jgi:ATPase subunit of ABC transporter with duplicated ATPase domains
MLALNPWNAGIIVISHDEPFITLVARGSLLLLSHLRHSDVLNTNTALVVWGWYGAKVQRQQAYKVC